MESSLPFALRVAAGLLVETVNTIRRLPTEVTTLPVTVLGRVAKLSFEINQQLSELATQGDQLLGSLHAPTTPPERTAWSTIDEEDEVAARDPQAAATWDNVTAAKRDSNTAATRDSSTADYNRFDAAAYTDPIDDAEGTPDPIDDAERTPGPIDDAERTPGPVDGPEEPAATWWTTPRDHEDDEPPARDARGDVNENPTAPTVETAQALDTLPPGDRRPESAAAADDSPDRALLADISDLEVKRPAPKAPIPATESAPDSTTDSTADSATDDPTRPQPADISQWTVAQLRGRVRSMSAEQVRAALEHEQSDRARPAFLTVLTNRLSTIARGGA